MTRPIRAGVTALVPVLALMLAAFSCATPKADPPVERDPAQQASLEEMFERVYHGYLNGQLLLNEFDRIISDRNYDGKVLQSRLYAKLLAVRAMVESFEDRINEKYESAIAAQTDPSRSAAARSDARDTIAAIAEFADGKIANRRDIPSELRGMVVSNLREKQAHLDEKLESIIAKVEAEDRRAGAKLRSAAGKLRSLKERIRARIHRAGIRNRDLSEGLRDEQGRAGFRRMEAALEEMATQIRADLDALESGRAPQQLAIEPNSGAKGNITGSGFPDGVWSITYDDGPRPKTSSEVLANLRADGVKATFFMLTVEVLTHKPTAVLIRDAGMDIASHSWTHAQLTKVDAARLDKEIPQAVARLESELGIKTKLFRLPYGAGTGTASIRQKIAATGLVHVFWNVDTLDWQDKNPDSILQRSLKQMKALRRDAGIVLFHDIHPQSVKASKMLVARMKADGKKLCTVQGAVDQINGTIPDCTK